MRFAIVGCLMLAVSASGPAKPGRFEHISPQSSPCYAQTRDWRAWIEPGSQEPELVVVGTVTTPTGESWNVLTLGRTPWDAPPRQFIALEIRAMSDIVTDVVTTEDVRGRFRVPPTFGGAPAGGLVIIECNGKEVGRTFAKGPGNLPR
jgi:hypothetical protein